MTLLSNYIRNVRIKKAMPFVRGDVLDLGCGQALIKDGCRDQIDSYVGVERGSDIVERLQAIYPDSEFYDRDLDTDSLEFGRKFDVVLMIALIEHMFNQKHLLGEVVRCLKPGGRVVITTPTPLGNDVVHRIGAAIGLFAKSAVDDHIVIYNRKRLGILAHEFGLAIDRYARFELGCNQVAVLQKQ